MTCLRAILVCLGVLASVAFGPARARAETVFGVVSERSAAVALEGARLALARASGHQVRLRTPEQLARAE